MLRAVAVLAKDTLLFSDDETTDCSTQPSLVRLPVLYWGHNQPSIVSFSVDPLNLCTVYVHVIWDLSYIYVMSVMYLYLVFISL